MSDILTCNNVLLREDEYKTSQNNNPHKESNMESEGLHFSGSELIMPQVFDRLQYVESYTQIHTEKWLAIKWVHPFQ